MHHSVTRRAYVSVWEGLGFHSLVLGTIPLQSDNNWKVVQKVFYLESKCFAAIAVGHSQWDATRLQIGKKTTRISKLYSFLCGLSLERVASNVTYHMCVVRAVQINKMLWLPRCRWEKQVEMRSTVFYRFAHSHPYYCDIFHTNYCVRI